MTAYGYLIYYLFKYALIFFGVIFLIGLIIAGAILPFYLWRKRKKRTGAIFAFVGWGVFLVILNRISCPTYWKYPDFVIRKMDLSDVRRIWGEYDFVAPAKEAPEEFFQVVGYKIGPDESGVDQYYYIYSYGHETGDWEYDTWIGKSEKYIENWYEYYTEGVAPIYYDLQSYVDIYVRRNGNVFSNTGFNASEDKMLSYLGVTRDEFLKIVYEQYPDFEPL